ncbi:MAG: carbon-nitrogen family hydrolase [Proteobacteria bacterium]|nr:carbon-nitrogen family hydrolase [Pseudomonadota bacterium]
MKRFKAAVVQFDVVLGKVEDNVNTVMAQLQDLEGRGPDLVLLPEMWSCGFDHDHLKRHGEKTPGILKALCRVAAEKHMAIAGSLPEILEDSVANTFYLIGPDGQIRADYRKIHLFTPGREHCYFSAGNRPGLADLSVGRMGLITCYDLRFPELSRSLTLNGIECLLVAAQWPRVRSEHWDVLLRARAIENQVFVLAANRCGSDPNLEYAGRSQMITPWGEVLVRAGEQEELLWADILPEELERARQTIPCLADRVPLAYRGREQDEG